MTQHIASMPLAGLAPLALGCGEDMDTAATWAHVGRRLLAEVGASWFFNGRDFVMFGLPDGHHPDRRIVIQLTRPGTYALMTGFVNAHNGIWTTVAVEQRVRLDRLRERVRDLCADQL